MERPLEHVVGAAVEGAHAVDRVGLAGREHDHGDVAIPRASRLALAEPPAQLELREQDEVGALLLHELEHLAVGRGAEHVEAVVAEMPLEVAASRVLRLRQEQRVPHDDRR